MTERPAHHTPGGRFRNPRESGAESPLDPAAMVRWRWDRLRGRLPPDPAPEALPRATPDPVEGRLSEGARQLVLTWIGHATFLIQLPGLNLLTDPIFSRRASPVRWAGPKRRSGPALSVEELPPIDAVLISHDHYDHLDARSVRRLGRRFGDAVTWVTPLGYRRWLKRRGVTCLEQLDWWEERTLERGGAVVRSLPARHWTRRGLFDARKRLWCSWSVAAGGRRLYFAGDSGYGPLFAEIGERAGPFDVGLLPIGAYAPRWIMRSSHMSPEEAAQACRDVRARAMVAMHWGAFRLADEPLLEPPLRARRAWRDLGLDPSRLYIPAVGGTLTF